MIDILKKALSARKHAGISRGLSLPKMMTQASPYITSLAGNARPPVTIYWSVNSVCNLRCKMCDVGTANSDSNFFKNLRIDGKLHEIDIERFKSVTDEVRQFKPMYSINSTEPLMYKPLPEAIAYARAADLEVAVTTGAYTLPQRAKELAEAGLTRLNVSIDGPAEIHNQIRGRKDTFEKSVTGIVDFNTFAEKRGLKPEITINYTITNMNYGSLEAFYDSISQLPIHAISFNYMNYINSEMADTHNASWGDKYRATVNCLSDEVRPEFVDLDVLMQQMQSLQSKGDPRVHFFPLYDRAGLERFFKDPMAFMGNVRCMSSWFIAQILASGEVMPYTRCYSMNWGNINEEPFMKIWNGEKVKAWRMDLRKNGRFPACTRCDMVY